MKTYLGFKSAVCVALLAAAFLGAVPTSAQAQQLPAQPIYVQNNTSRPVWVAARYKPPGSSDYFTNGFWKVEPGQKSLLFYNGNMRTIYLHVNDDLGSIPGRGTPIRQMVRGRAVDLYPEDTRADYDPWTLNID